ncbi:Rha family transcriptional regulator [uncultured Desulfovibrio sp.]|uniref:Rha family transcriptional regulator n=1 Tax=uncultured Desulfovibrio sp. TaxID=167968 RepID=UPI0026309192|nr:Rha family transcriptional regulator [uncultured Desulfovibrio sp.]
MNIEITVKELNGRHIPAVTSQQVAAAFGKEHKNVMRDIREIMDKCSESFNALNFELVTYKDAKGEERPMYLLTKDGLMMVTMGYTTSEAMRVKEAYIARFNEMEERLRGDSPAIPDFQNPALAARAWAEQYERRQIAEAQRDEAIRTKSQIGSNREATAMATASAAVRQRDALADRLGEGKTYKQVKAIPWLLDIFRESAGMYSQVGRKLAELGARMDIPPRIIEDSRYGTLKAHHVDVIEAFRLELKKDRNMLARYRVAKAA